ncbi:Multidrug efflux pump subunit AcrA (membrane-fusion protein) [Noviherbaspirillum humi]|uniref:Multidrug efflux pump subunit AcrA (Membrane-fusion protein) n=1 Tax=Noviherbaspirillum humi TaxID=1688639 RepID=A0A239G7H3_9BURK|nr:efflux RND transporter periplasmic adaptor subunit [Noviherbaspirillum humi]SNS64925.1 Multidrug efflux pump subunit AcrA (membrane-fusion protein) [Noviherbaspirillum humi]
MIQPNENRNRSASIRSTLIAATMLCAASAACAADYPTIPLTPAQETNIGVRVEKITAAAAGTGAVLRLPGSAVFPTRAIQLLSAPAAGVVESIQAEPMEAVAAGAALVTLRSPQLLQWQREYLQAALQARLAGEKLRRDQELFREGIVAESRLQESRSSFLQLEAAQNELRQSLRLAGMSDKGIAALADSRNLSSTLTISAPRKGVVIEQMTAIGQRVDAGAPLAKVAQDSQLWLELHATRQQAALLREGDAVEVEGCARPGKISAISPQLQASSQTLTVRVPLPSASDCVRPNQHVEGVVRTRAAPEGALRVSGAAIAGSGERNVVFLRQKGGFKPVEVEVVGRDAGSASVRGALRAGDEVATGGLAALKGMWLGLGSPAGEGK